MPVFYVRKEFFEALKRGEKKAEIRVGEQWVKLAEKIMKGEKPPIAVFKWGNKVIVRKIWKAEVFPNLRAALGSGRWRLLGLKAKTFPEAIDEVRKLYHRGGKGGVAFFWLKKIKVDPKRLKGILKSLGDVKVED